VWAAESQELETEQKSRGKTRVPEEKKKRKKSEERNQPGKKERGEVVDEGNSPVDRTQGFPHQKVRGGREKKTRKKMLSQLRKFGGFDKRMQNSNTSPGTRGGGS